MLDLDSGRALQARGEIRIAMAGLQIHRKGTQGIPEFRNKTQLLPKPKWYIKPSEEGVAPQSLAKTVWRGEEPEGIGVTVSAKGMDWAAWDNSLTKGVTASRPFQLDGAALRKESVGVALKPDVGRGL